MTRLQRFLILGSEGGSYYADERKLTLDNVKAVKRCITASEESGINAVTEIARISKSRRAAKPGPALFALAMAASYGSDKVRKTAFDFLNDVAVTGIHLQMFIDYIGPMRGWGRGLRKAVGNWYMQRSIKDAVYQAVKYRSRYNWTHRDLLRKSHPVGDGPWGELFAWITHGTVPYWDDKNFPLIRAYEEAKTATTRRLSLLIKENGLSWEMVPSEMLDKPEVWRALAQDMPMTALLRNLATLTRVGVIAPMDSAMVCEKIGTMARIHPIAVLTALLTYRAGKGVRGQHTWQPVPQVIDALDAAFGRSFSHAPQTNKRLYLGIDVSGSMASGEVAGVPGLSPRMAAAAMARREPNYYMAGFTGQPTILPLDITASDSISTAMEKTNNLPFGRTDCALPMLDAMAKNIPVDCFIILTTAELSLHPYHEAKAGGVATPNNPRHPAHRPGTEEGRDEPQTAEKTTAGQRARPVHQVPPRTCQAKQGPLRAVLQKDPRIRSQGKSRSQTGQAYWRVSLSHAHRAKKARRKPCLLFAASQTGRRATMDHGPAGEKNDGEYTVAARIRTAIVHPGPTIAHLYQRVLYGPYRYDLGGTRVDYSTSFSESVPYGPYPESTEGRPWGQPLKKPAGAPLNLG